MKPPFPPCPACGSSATLPFESSASASERQPVAEVVLAVLLFFLSLFAILMFFLLSRTGLPAAVLLAITLFLFWRRRRERRRMSRGRPRLYVCLDCSRNFRA
ncbi:MAG: hypothetical protein PHX05_01975 [Acidobacteriota bacterium]|nr:hypothetical protein [Acidobacteriota bacterium]